MTTSLLPVCRPVRPTIDTEAAGSLARATTATEVVALATVTVEPLAAAAPLTSRVAKVLSALSAATLIVVVLVAVLPLAAVTVTVTVFEPSWRLVLPVTTTDAALSAGVAITATELVPAITFTVEPPITAAPLIVNTARFVLLESAVTRRVTL